MQIKKNKPSALAGIYKKQHAVVGVLSLLKYLHQPHALMNSHSQLLIRVTTVQECDATDDAISTTAGNIIVFFFPRHINNELFFGGNGLRLGRMPLFFGGNGLRLGRMPLFFGGNGLRLGRMLLFFGGNGLRLGRMPLFFGGNAVRLQRKVESCYR